MGRLVDGVWVPDGAQHIQQGRFVRQPTVFRGWIRRDGSTPYAPEAGRYHLYASHACPWAHRVVLGRALYGLEAWLGVTVTDAEMLHDGWTFPEPDPVLGARRLRDVYVAADAHYTGRASVPVLWDRHTRTIVSNESRDVLRMLSREVAADGFLAPPALIGEIDATIDALYGPINDGVYKCGFARTQDAYDEAVTALFDALAHWDAHLALHPWLVGDVLTEADLCLFTTFARFDLVYYGHFKCNLKHGWDFPNLWRHGRQLMSMPAVRATVHPAYIQRHYYFSHESINPRRIVPAGPLRWLGSDAPAGR